MHSTQTTPRRGPLLTDGSPPAAKHPGAGSPPPMTTRSASTPATQRADASTSPSSATSAPASAAATADAHSDTADTSAAAVHGTSSGVTAITAVTAITSVTAITASNCHADAASPCGASGRMSAPTCQLHCLIHHRAEPVRGLHRLVLRLPPCHDLPCAI